MKPLIPRKTEFELSLEADREHAARGAALHKQKPLAVNIQDDKQRIRELEAALREIDETLHGELPVTRQVKEICKRALKGAK